MIDLPQFALSVRQPWAWAIIQAGKDIENRLWRKPNPGLNFRGRVCIHASKAMTQAEYHDANQTIAAASQWAHSPMPYSLDFGAIIGTVEIVDVVKQSESPWFIGPRPGLVGLVLHSAVPIPPIRVHGALGFFGWRQRLSHSDAPHVLPKWMRKEDESEPIVDEPVMGNLL